MIFPETIRKSLWTSFLHNSHESITPWNTQHDHYHGPEFTIPACGLSLETWESHCFFLASNHATAPLVPPCLARDWRSKSLKRLHLWNNMDRRFSPGLQPSRHSALARLWHLSTVSASQKHLHWPGLCSGEVLGFSGKLNEVRKSLHVKMHNFKLPEPPLNFTFCSQASFNLWLQ